MLFCSGVQFVFENTLLPSGNSCAVLIQIGVLDMRESLITEIIDQIIFEPLFTQLRNKEQIGYIVRSSVRKSNGCQGLLIFLQGDKNPSLMSERIFEVLNMIEVYEVLCKHFPLIYKIKFVINKSL